MNFRYTDRIRIAAFTSSVGLRNALCRFQDHIKRETLAADLSVSEPAGTEPWGDPAAGAARFEAQIAGEPLVLLIRAG
jgi:hypothetical protein